MSLLEDVFLQDEAGEAQELERIIEGDEYDERPRDRSDSDENSEKEDEAEEDKRRVDPASTKTKRVIKNPRFILNPARLTGPRGIQVIPEHFKDFKFKGKGHEKEDLDLVLKKLEHWAYRLYPRFEFEDCLKKIETLGKKRPVMVHLTKIRSDQLVSEETVVQQDSSDEEAPPAEEDEFDKLLAQQIELARNTPAPGSVKKPGFGTPITPVGDKISPITMPKATSSPSISDEQRERMIRNRRLAEERRLARLKAQTQNEENTIDLSNIIQNRPNNDDTQSSNKIDNVETVNEERNDIKARKNRSNIIDSSDSENDMVIDENINANDKNEYENRVAGKNNTSSVEKTNFINDIIDISKGYLSKQINQENTRFDQLLDVDSETVDITNDTAKSKEVISVGSDITDMTTTKDTRFGQLTVDSEVIDVTSKANEVSDVNSEIFDITEEENIRKNVTTDEIIEINEQQSEQTRDKRSRRSNVIDSSDSDDDFGIVAVNESITVDIHKNASQSLTKNTTDSEKTSEILNKDIDDLASNDIKNDNEKSNDETENRTAVSRDNDFEVVNNNDNKNDNKESRNNGFTKDLDLITDDYSPNKKADSQTTISLQPDLETVSENPENIDETNKADHNNVNKELIGDKDFQLEDLMDVDFSDDF